MMGLICHTKIDKFSDYTDFSFTLNPLKTYFVVKKKLPIPFYVFSYSGREAV